MLHKPNRLLLLIFCLTLFVSGCSNKQPHANSSHSRDNSQALNSFNTKYQNNVENALRSHHAQRHSGIHNFPNKRVAVVALARDSLGMLSFPEEHKSKTDQAYNASVEARIEDIKNSWRSFAQTKSIKDVAFVDTTYLRARGLYNHTYDRTFRSPPFKDIYASILTASRNAGWDYLILYRVASDKTRKDTLYTKANEEVLGSALETPYLGGLLFLPGVAYMGATSMIPTQKKQEKLFGRMYVIDLQHNHFQTYAVDGATSTGYRAMLYDTGENNKDDRDGYQTMLRALISKL